MIDQRRFHALLEDDLDSVCAKFKNPKVTLVVRAPDLDDGDVVIGNDDLDAAIAAINRLKNRTPAFCAHERLNEDGICRECGADCRRGS